MIEIVAAAGALYLAAVAALFWLQDGMLFPTGATPPPDRPLPAASERWVVAAEDGARLHGLVIPAGGESATVVLGFPGNAWNAQDFAVFLHERLPEATIVAFHYRGYPPSEGRPSERALTGDARHVAALVHARWPERAIVPVGVSIGSGVAAAIADQPGVVGTVLVSPFDSIRALAQTRYWWVPVGLLLRHPFDSAARLADVERPIAVLAAGRDDLIPPARTEALVARVPCVVSHRVFAQADHVSLYDDAAFGAALRTAVAEVEGERC